MSNKTFILPERDEEVPVNHLKKAQRKDVDSFHVPLFPVSIIIHDQSSSLCLLLISFYKISELFFISKLLKLIFLRVIRACFFEISSMNLLFFSIFFLRVSHLAKPQLPLLQESRRKTLCEASLRRERRANSFPILATRYCPSLSPPLHNPDPSRRNLKLGLHCREIKGGTPICLILYDL